VGPPLPSASSPVALAAAAASFNNATAVLQKRLRAQSGGGTQLVIANAIWTQNAALKPAYVNQMKTLYEVRSGV
jgi:serine protease inhibitor